MNRTFLTTTVALAAIMMATTTAVPSTAEAQSSETQKALRQLSSMAIISGSDIVDQLVAKSSVKNTRLPKIDLSQLKLDEDNSLLVVTDSIKNALFTPEIVEFASSADGRAVIQAAWNDTVQNLNSYGVATTTFYDTFVNTGIVNTTTAGHAFEAATVTLVTGQTSQTATGQHGQTVDPNRVAAE